MSRGYGGYAHLIRDDDSMFLYSYCAYNVNLNNWQEMKQTEDGKLWIERNALIEPEMNKHANLTIVGEKQVEVKRVKREYSVGELYDAGKIKIQNASGTWKTLGPDVDIIAVKILHKIFYEYQETGKVPEHVVWFI